MYTIKFSIYLSKSPLPITPIKFTPGVEIAMIDPAIRKLINYIKKNLHNITEKAAGRAVKADLL